jgi:para-aminobenzoate synthetase component 1
VGAVEEIAPEKNGLETLKNFISNKGQWSFGFLTYDLKNEIEYLSSSHPDRIGMPLLHFFKPEYILELGKKELIIHYYQNSIADPDKIFKEINETVVPQPEILPSSEILSRTNREEYIRTVNKIREEIRIGNIYELNYCQEFFSENCSLNPAQVYLNLVEISPMPFSCFYRYNDKYLISASPERFLKKEGSKIISQPIKGTIRKGNSAEEDALLVEQLYRDPKERSENVMIADLVRNDLSRIAMKGSVTVEELYGIYSFKQVHQMISTVKGEIREGASLVDILKASFPMGSMTGAPKVKAMELIEKYESARRGLFSGAVGYISPEGNFDFNVVIRSILYNDTNKYLSFMTGSAITFNSDPEKEYQECLLKAQAIREALK